MSTPIADDQLIKLFRQTMHQANNDLMAMVQESELALMSDDPDRMRLALEFVVDRVMEISRLHRETRRTIIERTERTPQRP